MLIWTLQMKAKQGTPIKYSPGMLVDMTPF